MHGHRKIIKNELPMLPRTMALPRTLSLTPFLRNGGAPILWMGFVKFNANPIVDIFFGDCPRKNESEKFAEGWPDWWTNNW